MPTITLDLRATPVRQDVKIWRVFPGQGYAFLDKFAQHSVVFLDLPEAVLPEVEITTQTPHIREIVKRAAAFHDYFGAMAQFLRQGEGDVPSRPSMALQDYTSIGALGRVGTGVSALINMFGAAQSGDLVIVPEQPRERAVRIGEFLGGPLSREVVAFEASEAVWRVSARPVKWLARVDEFRIPRSVSSSLRHQVAISETSDLYILELLDLAYGAYIFGRGTKGARVDTSAAEFSDQDNLDLSLMIKLCSRIAWEASIGPQSSNPFEDYISRLLPEEGNLSISTNINSPGTLNLKGTTFAPILFLALFSLLLTCDTAVKPASADVHVINTFAADYDPNAAAIEQMVRQSLEYMGKSEWIELRARSGRLASNPRLRTISRGSLNP